MTMFTSVSIEGRPVSMTKHVCRLAVQRVALRIQPAQALEQIVYLQQRARRVMKQAPENVLGQSTQINNLPALAQMRPVGSAQNRSAACRQNCRRGAGGQFIERGFFDDAKGAFALPVKKEADRAANALLNHVVGVDAPRTAG